MIHSFDTTLNDVANYFDELDTFYQSKWGIDLHHGLWISGKEKKDEASRNLSEKVLTYLGDLSHKRIFDIGCGYGTTTILAAERGAKSVTGMTLSTRQFQFARKTHQHENVNFILGDWLQNTLPNSSADGALSIECFSHINKKKKFFDEIYRTLKPGSRLVMTSMLTSRSPGQLNRKMILRPICEENRLPSLCDRKEIIELASSSGLEFIEHVDLSHKVWRTWLITLKELFGLILNTERKERTFALSILRIISGYKTGCIRYGLFVFRKP